MLARKLPDPLECCAEIAPLGSGPLEPERPSLSEILAALAVERQQWDAAGKPHPYSLGFSSHCPAMCNCPVCRAILHPETCGL